MDSGQVGVVLFWSALVVLIPTALGIGLGLALLPPERPQWIGPIVWLVLTLVGLHALADGRAVGVNDVGPSGLGEIIGGYFASFTGLLVAFTTCGVQLERAVERVRTERAWQVIPYAIIALCAFLFALATVMLFDYTVLVLPGGSPTIFASELQVFQLAPLGAIVLLIYALWAVLHRPAPLPIDG